MSRRWRATAVRMGVLAALAAVPERAGAAPPARVYLNFSDGTETLAPGPVDDAPRNVSSLLRAPASTGPYPAFAWPTLLDGSVSRRDLVRQVARQVHELFLPYNVTITTTRPAEGPYTMVVIGGAPEDLGIDVPHAGIAFMDCDHQQPSNVVFAFPGRLWGNLRGLVVTIAHEAGHALGLEHTASPRDLMFPRVDAAQAAFLDAEQDVSGTKLCGNTSQNSHRRLLSTVGPWSGTDRKPLDEGTPGDRTPPTLAFVEPAEGAVVTQPFVVKASVDDVELTRAVLTVGVETSSLRGGPFAWVVSGQPEGPLELVLTAEDTAGNVTTLRRRVTAQTADDAGGCVVGGQAPGPGRGAWILLVAAVAACRRGRRRL